MKRRFNFLMFLLLSHLTLSQVGIGTTSPHPSSILDIHSDEKGFLVPRVYMIDIFQSSLDGITPSLTGLMVFNTNPSIGGGSGVGFYYYNGTLWEHLVPKSRLDQLWKEEGGNIERQAGDVYIGNTNGTNNDLYLSNAIIDWDDPNYRLDPAAINKINEIEFDDGSVTDPSIRFDDVTTGFYSPGDDMLAYTINGTERLRIDAAGQLGVNTNNPQGKFDVAGTFTLGTNGTLCSGLGAFTKDFGTVVIPAGGSQTFSFNGITSDHNIPLQAKVNVSFFGDLGEDILLQYCWMENDAAVFRLYNKATMDVTKPIVARYLFLW